MLPYLLHCNVVRNLFGYYVVSVITNRRQTQELHKESGYDLPEINVCRRKMIDLIRVTTIKTAKAIVENYSLDKFGNVANKLENL